jgi:HAD superfamily hydrolase (TIGR01509 family)
VQHHALKFDKVNVLAEAGSTATPVSDLAVRKGLFLDLDGTLADSLPALKGVYYSFLERFGATGSEAEFQSLDGKPLLRIITSLRANHALTGEIEEFMTQYSAMIREAHEAAPLKVGAQLFLERARERSWRVALVTPSSHIAAREWLKRNRLSDHVDTVVGGDEVIHGKPAPDLYILALTRTNCTASGSIAVEDSCMGAHSAASAGLSTCVLGHPDSRPDWPTGVRFVTHFTDLLEML